MEDPALQFRNIVRQYAQQLGPQTTAYLMQTYQLGEPGAAMASLIGTLMDFGYTEDQLMQGPIGKLAQALHLSGSPADDDDLSGTTPAQPQPFSQSYAPTQPVAPAPPIRQVQTAQPGPATPESPSPGRPQDGESGVLHVR
jgi:hypothetical protein